MVKKEQTPVSETELTSSRREWRTPQLQSEGKVIEVTQAPPGLSSRG